MTDSIEPNGHCKHGFMLHKPCLPCGRQGDASCRSCFDFGVVKFRDAIDTEVKIIPCPCRAAKKKRGALPHIETPDCWCVPQCVHQTADGTRVWLHNYPENAN